VQDALASGDLTASRFDSYLMLLDEAQTAREQ